MPVTCDVDGCDKPAVLKRPKSGHAMCKECFFFAFEFEIHMTIVKAKLFKKGDRVAMGASGGKDSTVLAHVMKLLNERYDYGLELFLLSIDEGITGYRDDSLETVKQNRDDYGLPLTVLSYKDLYGWTMDEIVAQIGNKNNCTFCGTFRRQALDRGAALLKADMIVTGHNADDMAETVIMNIFRGDYARLSRCTNIVTQGEGSIPRCKPLKYAYEKEIVMYAHYKKLVYFSTECKYAPNAYRGHAREFVKQLERVRPTCILDIIESGENLNLKDSMKLPERQTCTRCGFVASQEICKACVLLEGLNTGNPKLGIGKTNKAKRAMGLKVEDGSENKVKTREQKGLSKKKLKRDMKKQKQQTMCGGGGGGGGGCGSGCGSQMPPKSEEESKVSETVCGPDHEKITIKLLEEWLDGSSFENLEIDIDLDSFSSDEEEMCGDDCPTKALTSDRKSACEKDAVTIQSEVSSDTSAGKNSKEMSHSELIALSCGSKCKNLESTDNSTSCCSVPSASESDDMKILVFPGEEETKKKKTCRCPPELLENPNHPEVVIDVDDDFGFDIHLFKSLMIAKHPEIIDEIRQVEKEFGENLGSTGSAPSSELVEKSSIAESEFEDREKIISEITSRLEKSASLECQSETINDNNISLPPTTNEVENSKLKSTDSTIDVNQSSDPVIVKANPIRRGASLITPEMMHKAPNNLDF